MITATVMAVVGWRHFEFDRALFTYAQILIISLGLTTWRFTIWLHRPPTRKIYRQALQMLKKPASRRALCLHLMSRFVSYFALNRFVRKRGLNRWSAHWPIMVGCVMAMAIVVPLIFGWVWFETPHDDFQSYKVMNFGVHLATIPVDGAAAFIAFHGLVWAAIPVVIGCSVALWRRMNDRGDQAVQTISSDLLPLFLLLAIALTGLLMTASYSFFGGAFHKPLAGIHMMVVGGTLLWLPYSKLFHIPQRTLKLFHMIYEHEAGKSGGAICARCGEAYASRQQVDDLIAVQRQLGYQYEMDTSADHYQMICPRCRRSMLVLTQGQQWRTNDPRADLSMSETCGPKDDTENTEISEVTESVVKL